MRRKVYEQLKKWKEEQNGESAVLINGALYFPEKGCHLGTNRSDNET